MIFLQFLQRGEVLTGSKDNHLIGALEVWLESSIKILQLPQTLFNYPLIMRVLIRSLKKTLQEILSLPKKLNLNLPCLVFLKRPLSHLLLEFINLLQSVTCLPHPLISLSLLKSLAQSPTVEQLQQENAQLTQRLGEYETLDHHLQHDNVVLQAKVNSLQHLVDDMTTTNHNLRMKLKHRKRPKKKSPGHEEEAPKD
jgi:hypothetical protein